MDNISTSSYMAASSPGGRSFRKTHLIATFFPVARCVPRHTVANDPDLSCDRQIIEEDTAVRETPSKNSGLQHQTYQ